MTTETADISALYDAQAEQIHRDYFEFLSFPSVSTEPDHAHDVLACKEWLEAKLKQIGLTVETWETEGYPTLFAEDLRAGPDKPTLLLYNHYDVQPVDPLEEWISPPFEPTVRDGQVYARGASDNKGQCFYVWLGLRFLYEKYGKLPINVKWVIEGEEESGSHGLGQLMQQKRDRLQADHLALVDVDMRDANTPTVVLGCRGIVTFELEAIGSKGDLHSGLMGGIAYNPLHAVVEVLSQLHDQKGKVTIPGFYDGIEAMSEEERELIDFSFDQAACRKSFSVEATGGEQEYSPNERAWIRPTLEINGIGGGYFKEGFKTVIPAKVIAKISCRLVPGQDPRAIQEKVIHFIQEKSPTGVEIKVKALHGNGRGYRADANAPVTQAAASAYESVFGKPCIRVLSGGSLPIIHELAEASGADTVGMGVALPDDAIHAPNEHFGLDRLKQGCCLIAQFVLELEKAR